MATPPTGPLPPTTPALPVSRSDLPGSTWRVGQVLAATVVSSPQAGQSELRIGNLLVRAQTGALNLSPGQTLRLEVASLREMPVLRLLNLLQQNPVNLAIRNTLPQQQPLAPLLASLTRIVAQGTANPQLAPEVARLARELFSKLPDTASVTQAKGLRQALRDSGLFMESKIAQTPPGKPPEVAQDLKANLIRLVQVLRQSAANSAPATGRTAPAAAAGPGAAPTPAGAATALPSSALAAALAQARLPGLPTDPLAPLQRGQPPLPQVTAAVLARAQLAALTQGELQRQAEGALARVQLNQLSSLTPDRAAAQEWLIELPVRRDTGTDLWSLRISRESEERRSKQRAAQPAWSVMLAFDLPGLGPMQTRVTLRGDSVAAQFFSQKPDVLPTVVEHFPTLHARLQAAGLEVADLTCHQGQIPADSAAAKPRILDERV